jgi:phage shock protein A
MEDLSDETIKKIQDYTDYVLLKEVSIKEVEDTKDKLKNDINTFHILNHT